MKNVIWMSVLVMALAPAALAQQPTPAPPSQTVNPVPPLVTPHTIRFDLTITDSGGGKPTATKTLSMTVAERTGGSPTLGSIRSTAPVPGLTTPASISYDKEGKVQGVPPSTVVLPLNFDVRDPQVYADRSVKASITVEYQPYVAEAKTPPPTLRANSTSMFEDGKKTVLLQAADPISDRRTTIEVTATVLK